MDGSRELQLYPKGNINLFKLFTVMTTAADTFDEVLYPKHFTITSDGTYTLPDDCNLLVQRDPSNNQKIITLMNNNILPIGTVGKPYIQSVTGSYDKLYKLNINSLTPVNFTEGNFRTLHIFE
jgi:hypothetical protein